MKLLQRVRRQSMLEVGVAAAARGRRQRGLSRLLWLAEINNFYTAGRSSRRLVAIKFLSSCCKGFGANRGSKLASRRRLEDVDDSGCYGGCGWSRMLQLILHVVLGQDYLLLRFDGADAMSASKLLFCLTQLHLNFMQLLYFLSAN